MAQTVLIIGASRGIGLATVKGALATGHRVRAFARRAAQIPLDDPHLEKISGDALNGEDIARALNGTDVVIQALGIPVDARMLTGPIGLFSGATQVLVPKMEQAGVTRLIAVTGFGSGDGRQHIPPLQRIGFELFLGRAYSDKDRQEELIKNSSLDWTIVRPGVLTSGNASGQYRVLDEPQSWRNGLISRADVADFIVKQITGTAHIAKTPVLIGRCSLPHI